ncbi:MAG: hypothetical protein OXO54_05300 [Chloroflexota bacterium]|nr:hypothetical protein [Chloroflexota bacterium]MDE2897716.1 hypothetical protein [Chloroflexota bacterium]
MACASAAGNTALLRFVRSQSSGLAVQLDFAFICDYADSTAKVVAVGIGFDQIHAPSLPARHPRLCVVARFRAHKTEIGQKQARVVIMDADGAETAAVQGIVDLADPVDRLETTATLVVNFDNLNFDHYGPYATHVLLDANEMHRIPFEVSAPPTEG